MTGARSRLGKSLLVVQVAVSLMLLVGSGLFLRTLHNLRQVDVGFNPQNLLLFRINPSLMRFDEKRHDRPVQPAAREDRQRAGRARRRAVEPGAAVGQRQLDRHFVRGRVYPAGQRDLNNSINRLVISTNFFEMMEIPLVLGRGFTPRDNETAPKVVVINEAAAKKYFPNENPVGQRFGSSVETTDQLEIVGVLRDAKYNSVRDPAPPTMYVPYLQARAGSAVIEVRTAGDPVSVTSGVREAVRQVEPNLPMMDVSTQLEQVERRFAQEKIFAQAYTLFGGLALLVASIGLFGLMSYAVARRTNEIGIRMALGAQRGDVMRQVLVRVDDPRGDRRRNRRRRLARRRPLRLDAALRAGADRRADDRRGHGPDDRGLGAGRIPACATRVAGRSDGGAQVRLTQIPSSKSQIPRGILWEGGAKADATS